MVRYFSASSAVPGSTSSQTVPSSSVSCQCCSTCPCGESTSVSVDWPSSRSLTYWVMIECSQGSRSGPVTVSTPRLPRSMTPAAVTSARCSPNGSP